MDVNKMIDSLKNVPSYIIRKMCIKVIEVFPGLMYDVPDQDRPQEMYIKVVEQHPGWLYAVPNRFKTKGMFEKAVHREPYLLQHVPGHLKTRNIWKHIAAVRCPWSF